MISRQSGQSLGEGALPQGGVPRWRRTMRRPQFWFAASGLLPALAWYWSFSWRPILRAVQIAVSRYNLLNPSASQFVGLRNFQQLIENPLFVISVRNTLSWAILEIGLTLPLSLLLASCLASLRRWRNLYQGLLFVPVVVSLVAISLLFRMLMDPETGQFNQILHSIGLPTSRWLVHPSSALGSCIMIVVWKSLGVYTVILTAGMLNIPQEYYEAALVDGVDVWQRFLHITLPLLGHTLLLVSVLLAIGSLQQFTLPYVMTKGGPGRATYLYNLHIYDEAFANMRFGIATAAALIQLVFVLVISLIQIRLLRPKWSY
ncbi:MAG: carbohydrate ABC transporter permease [Anaerolineae bacterium]